MRCIDCQQSNLTHINGQVFCANCGQRAAERLGNFSYQQQHRPQPHVLDLSSQATTQSASPQSSVTPTAPSQAAAFQSWEIPAAVKPLDTESAQSAVTTMQPHQTYALKDNPAGQDPEPVAALDATATTPEPAPLQTALHQEQKTVPQARTKRWSLGNFFRSNAMRVGVASLSIVLLAGYITYLNYPTIAVRVAANRANIPASIPDYTPSGYQFSGPITYGEGQLTISFRSDDATIAVSQSATNWDSQSLLENHIRYQTASYDTFRESGLTIFTYDERHAVWVNGGILYEIESSELLDHEEIVKIASSI